MPADCIGTNGGDIFGGDMAGGNMAGGCIPGDAFAKDAPNNPCGGEDPKTPGTKGALALNEPAAISPMAFALNSAIFAKAAAFAATSAGLPDTLILG